MRFYKGGLSYTELENMPYSKIFKFTEKANKISALESQDLDTNKGGHTYYG